MNTCIVTDCNKPAVTKRKPNPCKMHDGRMRRHGTYDDPREIDTLPTAPLLRHIENIGGNERLFDEWTGHMKGRAFSHPTLAAIRNRKRAHYAEIDEVACALGRHPAEIYGEAWWDAA